MANDGLRLSGDLQRCLVCPTCRQRLVDQEKRLWCDRCREAFPVVAGVPVLLRPGGSVFTAASADHLADHVFSRGRSRSRAVLRSLAPKAATNLYASRALSAMRADLGGTPAGRARVLVIGAGDGGECLSVLAGDDGIEVVRSDVVRTPEVSVVLDAHDIPFEDGTFDGVVAQAVLEHVLDPIRCVSEVTRVLRPAGLVYVETPFMQQVHGGRYDFTRYTRLGHRRLLRGFEELDSGIVAGPGTALAWAWEYFLMSFCRSSRSRSVARAAGRMTSFFLKYADRFLLDRPGASDGASAFGFLGRKSPEGSEFSDSELVASYAGLIR